MYSSHCRFQARILITQHMPPGFTRSFAERLNKLCQISVKEWGGRRRARAAEYAYIAPGDKHMELARSGGELSNQNS